MRFPLFPCRQCLDDLVDGFFLVDRDLHRQNAARTEQLHHFPEQFRMVRNPLDAGVGKHHIKIPVQRPQFRAGIAQLKPHFRMRLCRRPYHFRRTVHAQDIRLRKPLPQHLRAVSRTAANVDDLPWLFQRNPCRQISGRLCPLCAEFQILRCIPAAHDDAISFSRRSASRRLYTQPQKFCR